MASELNLQSGIRGVGGCTTVHPAFLNMSIWLQGRSGLDNTSPGPMMLKVASMCIGLGSLKLSVCTRIPRGARWRFIHSMPMKLVTCLNYYITVGPLYYSREKLGRKHILPDKKNKYIIMSNVYLSFVSEWCYAQSTGHIQGKHIIQCLCLLVLVNF